MAHYFSGNPKNGGSGHTLYLNINSITETEGWEDFIKEVTSKWRQIPGLRFHWAKQWGMLNGIEDFIRDVRILLICETPTLMNAVMFDTWWLK